MPTENVIDENGPMAFAYGGSSVSELEGCTSNAEISRFIEGLLVRPLRESWGEVGGFQMYVKCSDEALPIRIVVTS